MCLDNWGKYHRNRIVGSFGAYRSVSHRPDIKSVQGSDSGKWKEEVNQ